jgi:hypothetical protein
MLLENFPGHTCRLGLEILKTKQVRRAWPEDIETPKERLGRIHVLVLHA